MHSKISLSPKQTGCDSGSVVLTGAEMQKLDGKTYWLPASPPESAKRSRFVFAQARANVAIHYRSGAGQAEFP